MITPRQSRKRLISWREKRVDIALMSVIVKHATTTKYMKQVQPREFKPNGIVLRCADVGGKNSGDGKILANWKGQYKVKTNTGNGAYTLEILTGKPYQGYGMQ